MCTPSLAALAISAIAVIATTTVTVIAQQEAAKNAKTLAEHNALIKNLQADSVLDAAVVAADALSRKRRQFLGLQQARLASSGVSISEGAALEIQLQTIEDAALDRATVFHNAQLQANALRAGADIELFKGDIAQANALGQSIATGVAGLAQLAQIGVKVPGNLPGTTPPAAGVVPVGGFDDYFNVDGSGVFLRA